MNATLPVPKIKRVRRDMPAHGRSFALPPAHVASHEHVPSHDLVARRAYEIWQRHGCPEGTGFQDWLAAETELRSRR